MAQNVINPRLNQLVHMEDILDSTAGAYPFPPHMPSFSELNWVFAPYDNFRAQGGLGRKDSNEYRMVIDHVGERINRFLVGKSESVKIDTRYTILQKHSGWHMIKEIGANARIGLFNDGIDAFVSVSELGNNRYAYSIGRRSLFIPFPVSRILEQLNAAEGNELDRWGGAPTIGGSPRVSGSALTPDVVAAIIDKVIAHQ
jgi:hypothetical protein